MCKDQDYFAVLGILGDRKRAHKTVETMRIILTTTVLLIGLLGHAQNGTYLTDLATLRAALEKTPSFREQIIGDRLQRFDNLFRSLAADSGHDASSLQYFTNLASLLFLVRDNHLGLYVLPRKENAGTQAGGKFPDSPASSDCPGLSLNTDSLGRALARGPRDSVEGIFHSAFSTTVAVFRSAPGEYTGMVIATQNSSWRKQDLAFRLYDAGQDVFQAIYVHPQYKTLVLKMHERYAGGRLVHSSFNGSQSPPVYAKRFLVPDHRELPSAAPLFAFRDLDSNTQYISLRSFDVSPQISAMSKAFHDSIRTRVTAKNLVVDLRGNGGGAWKESMKYVLLVRQVAERGRVYVITNPSTMSAAEIFTLRLKRSANVITAGENTSGALSYGSNAGMRVRLPGSAIEFYPTDMMGEGPSLSPYEGVGLKPDRVLSPDRDWIAQVLELIEREQ